MEFIHASEAALFLFIQISCISLMSNTKQQDIRKLSNQMKKFLETTKTVE